MHTAKAQLETDLQGMQYGTYTSATPIGRGWPHLDVEIHVERPPETQQTHAERPAAAREPLHSVGIFELLGHITHQRSHTSHSKAENMCASKLLITGNDIPPREQSR